MSAALTAESDFEAHVTILATEPVSLKKVVQALKDKDLDLLIADYPGAARSRTLAIPDLMHLAHWGLHLRDRVMDIALILQYSDEYSRDHGRGGKKRKPIMDVDALVLRWRDMLIALAISHEPEDRTRADYQTDELMGPVLTAPIVQVRELATKLATALREDPRTPFMVWSTFEKVVAPMIVRGPDGPALELRRKLAMEVAELAQKSLDPADWLVAMAGALQWRNAEALTEVKTAIEAGAKPKIRGRESCLFLEAEKEDGATVLVVL